MVQQFMKWKKKAYIQSFLRKEFLKGGNAAVTQLLNLLAIRDVSANADVLKACFDKYFDLIKENSIDDSVLKMVYFNLDRWSINEYRM